MADINLDYYRGPDAYSDGAIEDELLALVQERRDLRAFLENDRRWPALYHLSPARRGLLEWFPFRPDAELLEIGAGCGALTGLFCEKVRRVVAVELSAKRGRIVYERHRAAPNLEVRVGNFMEMPWERRFDYITLIGVLEYAGSFVQAPRPGLALLRQAVAVLKPEGVLFVAIENKFGVKYFAGAPEDHTGRPFDGIEGYPSSRHVETFARDELERLLREAGCAAVRFYYPHPDYKFPGEIFSDAHLPDAGHVLADAPGYDRERIRLFSEKLALANIVRSGLFDVFANSFLTLAGRTTTEINPP